MIQAVPTTTALSSATTATPDAKSAAQTAKLKTAAQQFEAVFLRQMMGSMRKASLGDGMFDNEGTEQFQDMADSKTADAMSSKGVLHIADLLMKQLQPLATRSAGGTMTVAAPATKTTDTASEGAAQ
jgi:flagellar protein FlgJ